MAGRWGPGSVSLRYQWLRNGAPISHATGSTYVVGASDLDRSLSVRVAGSKAGYSSTANTSRQFTVGPAGVLSAPTPGISGAVKVGSRVSAVAGRWGPGSVALRYQWLRNGAPISHATASTYVGTATDLGHSVSVRVTGSKSGYHPVTRTSRSLAVGPAGALSAPTPGISGAVKVDSRVSAVPGRWGPGSVSLRYQWLRNGAPISHATGSTYVFSAVDLGRSVSVRVTGSKSGYYPVTRTSRALAVGPAGALSAPTPGISGAVKVDSRVSAVPGRWGPGSVALRYQWLRNGAPISSATDSTYVVTAADLGRSVSVRVTGSKSGYYPVTRTSRASTVGPAGPLSAPTPGLAGAMRVGFRVTAVPGAWGPGPVTLRYQWLRNGAAISGATGSSYVVAPGDAGKYIAVKVTGTKPGYSSVTRTGHAYWGQYGALNAPVPSVSGTARVAARLSANSGTWGPGPVALRYQWLRSGAPISSATGSSYVLTDADAGKAVSVTVTGAKGGYATTDRTSRTTAPIQAAPPAGPTLADPMVAESFRLINDYRARHSLAPLRWNAGLAGWSQKWSIHLAYGLENSTFDGQWHNPTFYQNFPGGWTAVGENAALNTSAQTLFNWWVGSPEHNANMLRRDVTDFGFGYVVLTSGPYAGLRVAMQDFAAF